MFLFFLIAVTIAVPIGIVGILAYFVMAGSQPVYDIIVCLVLFCIAIPLTIFQYYHQRNPLVKKVLLGILITLLTWTTALILTEVLKSWNMTELATASGNLINLGYIPLLAMLLSVLKQPGSRRYDPAIGRFIIFFAATTILIICLASAYLAVERGTISADALLGTIILGLDVIIMASAALLVLSYMPTGYRYIFTVIILVGILCFTADGMLLITTLGLADFTQIYQYSYGALILIGTMAMIGLSLVNITPTTVEEVDKKLSDTRMQMEDIVMQSPDATALFNKDGDVIMANGQLHHMFYIPDGGALEFNLFDHVCKIRPDLKEQMSSVRNGQTVAWEDLPIHLPGQSSRQLYLSIRIFPTFTAEGKISGYVAIAQDTTDRRLAEEALRRSNEELEMRVKERTSLLEQTNEALQREIEARMADEKQIKESLNEKEVLLKEIHHRVKNNLQIVSSMLSLQSSTVRDPAIVAMNLDSQSRIRSMALIHEKLYQTRNLSRIDFGEYAKSLVQFIQGSYNARHISITIEIENIWLDIDKAIPCGLIINELFSNCLKHAFTGRDHGEVYISMREEGDRYVLTVRDDGPGMKPGLDLSTSTSLGLSLVSALAGQLEGELLITCRNGAEFTIRFPAGTHGKNPAPARDSNVPV